MFFSFFLLIDPYCHLRHWWSVLDFSPKHRRRTACVKTAALLFSMYTPAPAAAATRRPATLHANCPISQRSPRVKCCRKGAFFFSFLFFFCSGDDYYSCWRTAARRFLCVLGAAVCFALDIYTKIGYITWFIGRKKLYIKSGHSAPPITRMEWSCVLPTSRLWDWQSNQAPSIESSSSRLFGVTPRRQHHIADWTMASPRPLTRKHLIE